MGLESVLSDNPINSEPWALKTCSSDNFRVTAEYSKILSIVSLVFYTFKICFIFRVP